MPEATRNYLNFKIGDKDLKLCMNGYGKCYRARIAVIASKFPGFAKFAKHYQLNFLKPQLLINEAQMKFILSDIHGDIEIPKSYLQLKLKENVTPKEVLELRSNLQSNIDADNAQVLNFR